MGARADSGRVGVTKLNDLPLASLQFYATAPYPCSYLSGAAARSQVATPSHLIDTPVYSELVRMGFRRSGAFTYRPYCDHLPGLRAGSGAGRSIQPNKTQRKCKRLHANLKVVMRKLAFDAEHYALYLRYQQQRHPGGGMDQDSREQYQHFPAAQQRCHRSGRIPGAGVLRIVSLVDRLADGLSSVYTFFEPGIRGSSYGTYNILWQIDRCRNLGLPHLYLGYWIAEATRWLTRQRSGLLRGW
jgi:arginine-tRNA-protein transferase